MHTTRTSTVAIAIALAVTGGWFVSAAASAGETTRKQTAAAMQGDAQPDAAQIARGAKAWADTCGRCHNLRAPNEFSDKNWDIIVTHMRVIAPLPGRVADDIKAFLKSSN